MTDPRHVAALARAVLSGDHDVCGVLADYLDERGDPRGRLLRNRWKRWKTVSKRAKMLDEWAERDALAPWRDVLGDLRASGVTVSAATLVSITTHRDAVDDVLRRYVRERFPEIREVPR